VCCALRFGNPANSKSPVALRPLLAKGLPFFVGHQVRHRTTITVYWLRPHFKTEREVLTRKFVVLTGQLLNHCSRQPSAPCPCNPWSAGAKTAAPRPCGCSANCTTTRDSRRIRKRVGLTKRMWDSESSQWERTWRTRSNFGKATEDPRSREVYRRETLSLKTLLPPRRRL
jgi:hypothetical protein